MAATRPKTLVALTGAALSLPGMMGQSQAATPATKVDLEGGIFYYDEGSDRIKVTTLQQDFVVPLTDDMDLSGNLVLDSISGASPIYNEPVLECAEPNLVGTDAVSGASGIRVFSQTTTRVDCQPTGKVEQVISPVDFDEERKALDLKVNYYRGDRVVSLGGGISDESDYKSKYLDLEVRQELNQKLTTLAFGVSYADDLIEPVDQPGVSEGKDTLEGFLGVTQVLDKYSLVQVNLTYRDLSGFLSDPYKYVYLLDSGSVLLEQRPDSHHQWNLLGRYVRHFPAWDSTLHLDYRYSWDDWGVTANTLETAWTRSLADSWLVTLGVRYYSQNEADFYSDYFDSLPADGYFSSDYRLATFGTLSYLLMVSKDLTDSVRMDVGVEYSERRVGLALQETDNTDSTDYDFLTFSIGWKISF